ncbi:hypothetical protein HPP92_005004 [Vanilla planifolia]|uniref:Uncharacterized protein n=1 Tax=Vanilla planifolia TaxID=51239 RepID=A0A835RT80_VANPL|nr:hypothetical protein HPP92_005341 [Vanilla planifolia]KAG0494010.1 hypothetical protein HPP92_005004 [Vanilla planifolia]
MEWSHRYEDPNSLPSPFPSPSLRQKIRSAICFSCCFRGAETEEEKQAIGPSFIRSSSTWIRAKAGEIPEIKEKCRGLISRIGKPSRRGYGDFKYDPLSYKLNFDEGGEDYEADSAEEFFHRNFSSRLPPTPAHPVAGISYN